ncbi:MAG: hypothetical protein OXH81_23740, partial [Gemmatimonadetes bacterium]|nr:hypothetical protein [Gemmatimonadota bacterium]
SPADATPATTLSNFAVFYFFGTELSMAVSSVHIPSQKHRALMVQQALHRAGPFQTDAQMLQASR